MLREYNDVRDICAIYVKLLGLGIAGQTYNLATGRTYCLQEVMSWLEELSHDTMQIRVNPQFVHANEIACLSGDGAYLCASIGDLHWRTLDETLCWMLVS